MKTGDETQAKRGGSRPTTWANHKIAIDKERVNAMPLVTFPGKIFVIDSFNQVNAAITALRKSPVVGLDTETRPTFKRGVHHTMSLIQLSTKDVCFLFRTNKIGVPAALAKYLADASCLKVGLSLLDDFHSLHRISNVKPAGYVEIQKMVGKFHIADLSLQKIYAILFGRKISKAQQLSNWEAPVLTKAQRQYAAIDAWACIRIYEFLASGNFNPETSPFKVEIIEDNQNLTDDTTK